MSNTWISGNFYLDQTAMANNVSILWDYFGSKGWTANAVAALAGNMEAESNVNPGLWENFDEGNLAAGFGLVQWTPATKLRDWIEETYGNTDYTNGDYQMARIIWELENGVQYYSTPAYPESFREFTVSTREPAYLAEAFLINYERPADQSESVKQFRGQLANKWFSYITGLPAPEYTRIPIWLLFKMRGG